MNTFILSLIIIGVGLAIGYVVIRWRRGVIAHQMSTTGTFRVKKGKLLKGRR